MLGARRLAAAGVIVTGDASRADAMGQKLSVHSD